METHIFTQRSIGKLMENGKWVFEPYREHYHYTEKDQVNNPETLAAWVADELHLYSFIEIKYGNAGQASYTFNLTQWKVDLANGTAAAKMQTILEKLQELATL